MSEFNDGGPSSSGGYPYTVLASQYTPATTVAISLRQFEKEAKTQAEREYDADHGPLPEPPADDDTSMPVADVQRLKKKRKVRSAIVSRRKSAIYLEKLESELELKDSVNAHMETRLGVFKDVLRETSARIDAVQKALSADPGHSIPKRPRHHQHPPHHHHSQHHSQQQDHGGPPFFLDDPIDDILSISPDEIVAIPGYKTQPTTAVQDVDESPSGQSSPVTPRFGRYEAGLGNRELPRMCLTDSVWKSASVPGALAQGLPYRDQRTF